MPIESDSPDLLIRGLWVKAPGPNRGGGGGGGGGSTVPRFTPDDEGQEFAVTVGTQTSRMVEGRKAREGLRVLMSDDPILLFRQKFFKFQRDLRQDDEISYFDIEAAEEQKPASTNAKAAKKVPDISEFV